MTRSPPLASVAAIPAVSESPAPRWSSAVARRPDDDEGAVHERQCRLGGTGGDDVLGTLAGERTHRFDHRGRVVGADPVLIAKLFLADLEHVDAAGEHLTEGIPGEVGDDLGAVGPKVTSEASIGRWWHDGWAGRTAEHGDVGFEAFQQNDPVELVELVAGQWIARHGGQLDALPGAAVMDVGAVASGGGNAVHRNAFVLDESAGDPP